MKETLTDHARQKAVKQAWRKSLKSRAKRKNLWVQGDRLIVAGDKLKVAGSRIIAKSDKFRKDGNNLSAEGDLNNAKGALMWADGSIRREKGKKLRAEAERLYLEGYRISQESNIAFVNAVIKAYGKTAKIEWLECGSCRINGMESLHFLGNHDLCGWRKSGEKEKS